MISVIVTLSVIFRKKGPTREYVMMLHLKGRLVLYARNASFSQAISFEFVNEKEKKSFIELAFIWFLV